MAFKPNFIGAFIEKLLHLISLSKWQSRPSGYLVNKPTEKFQLLVCGYISITHLSGIGSATTMRHPASRTAPAP